MNSILFEKIQEQLVFNFTGRINILDLDSGQYLGVVLLRQGALVGSSYGDFKADRAIFRIFIDEMKGPRRFQFVIEPEVIEKWDLQMEISKEEVEPWLRKYIEEYLSAEKLRPPNNLNLSVNPDIILSSKDISLNEFRLLCLVTKHDTVTEIYKRAPFLDDEITLMLVRLRRKGALLVRETFEQN